MDVKVLRAAAAHFHNPEDAAAAAAATAAAAGAAGGARVIAARHLTFILIRRDPDREYCRNTPLRFQ